MRDLLQDIVQFDNIVGKGWCVTTEIVKLLNKSIKSITYL
jgi:predicted nucleotide-binding protein (sugar kinase/HSP70/actin superfamily)